MKSIILASRSPYRKSVLEKLQLPFTTISPDINEQQLPDEKPETLVKRLSVEKAVAVAQNHSDAFVIGSDQVAVINGEIIGKPHDHQHAIKQLQLSSGKKVTFLTGICLYNTTSNKYQLDLVPYHVVFRQLSNKQIENYLLKEKPYNSAGSFKSEGLGICLFEKLIGDDPNTLIGLPLIRLIDMFRNEGIAIV